MKRYIVRFMFWWNMKRSRAKAYLVQKYKRTIAINDYEYAVDAFLQEHTNKFHLSNLVQTKELFLEIAALLAIHNAANKGVDNYAQAAVDLEKFVRLLNDRIIESNNNPSQNGKRT